jgi:hypothetical protein
LPSLGFLYLVQRSCTKKKTTANGGVCKIGALAGMANRLETRMNTQYLISHVDLYQQKYHQMQMHLECCHFTTAPHSNEKPSGLGWVSP